MFLASTNPGKLREFGDAAASCGIVLAPLAGLRDIAPCVEDGQTFEENARKKAVYYSGFTTGMVFADDSGLCVDILGGAPGVYSARFAGPDADDAANNSRLISELQGVDPERRTAHYVCVIALAEAGRVQAVVEGTANGWILEAPRGLGGFGYDPYFYYPPLGKTFAELAAADKFAVSHRGKAFRRLLEYLAA